MGNIRDGIERYRRKCKEHLRSMSNKKIPQVAVNYGSTGKRNIGRPRKRWKYTFEDVTVRKL